jgi:glycosyltransferase involved in cell wall biosynthesis
MKVRKFIPMMKGQGRKVILYAGEYCDVEPDEHVVLISEAEREGWFGPHDERDLERGGFSWNSTDPWWQTMNNRAIKEIGDRADKQDLLLILAGWAQQPIAAALPVLTACEWGVGYEGICTKHRAFESYAWMHHILGKRSEMKSCAHCGVGGIPDFFSYTNGFFYDAVIPNYFDPAEFYPVKVNHVPEDGYLFFFGRLIERKGVHIAAQISQRTGIPLKIAGPGAIEWGDGWVRYPEGRAEAPGLEYVGVIDVQQRAEYLSKALVTLVPTVYVEPFGGVAVEAMMAGCPVVTTDWGAFTETVKPGVSGYRFHTLQQGADAVRKAILLDRKKVQEYALQNYSLEAVAPMYNEWFDRLDGLWGPGWNA